MCYVGLDDKLVANSAFMSQICNRMVFHQCLQMLWGEFRGQGEDKMLDTTPHFHSKKSFIDMSIYYTFIVFVFCHFAFEGKGKTNWKVRE